MIGDMESEIMNDNNVNANFITVTAENGQKFQAEVLDIFKINGYEDKDYILYSFGESVDQDNEKVYVSILQQDGDTYNLKEISDSVEWNAVQEAVSEGNTLNGGE